MIHYGDLPEEPTVVNLQRTGWPDGREPPAPTCPVCGAECESVYKDASYNIVGCDICLHPVDAWDCPECLSGKEC